MQFCVHLKYEPVRSLYMNSWPWKNVKIEKYSKKYLFYPLADIHTSTVQTKCNTNHVWKRNMLTYMLQPQSHIIYNSSWNSIKT